MKLVFLLFRESDNWTTKFLEDDFGHVSTLLFDGDRYIAVDPRHDHIVIQTPTMPPEFSVVDDLLNSKLFEYCIMLKIDDETHSPSFPLRLFNPLNCVGIAKYICGIRKPLIVTPYQLYKYFNKCHNTHKYPAGIINIDILK